MGFNPSVSLICLFRQLNPLQPGIPVQRLAYNQPFALHYLQCVGCRSPGNAEFLLQVPLVYRLLLMMVQISQNTALQLAFRAFFTLRKALTDNQLNLIMGGPQDKCDSFFLFHRFPPPFPSIIF